MSAPRGPKYPQEFLDRIRDAVNIVEVVGEHVVLRKSGANHNGLCPFHNERSPSFSVNEVKGVYHCHGCKAGGDLFTFVREIYGVGFPEAVRELADRAGLKMPDGAAGTTSSDPETARRQTEARERRILAQKLNRYTAAFFRQALVETPGAIAYLRSRGVTEELERNFYIGLAPPSWDALTRKLISSKAPLELAVKLGLIRPSTKAPKPGTPAYFDLFRARMMFPIVDLRGKVAGFGGRILPPDVMGEGAAAVSGSGGEPGPKYMNSPESPLFQKGKLLYGLHPARKHIREQDEVILVEGFFDVLALHAAGFENAVATCGTALTPDHLTQLKRFASKITVLFDSDSAGVAATERAMELGLEQGVVVHGAAITGGKDPGDLIQQADGRERLAEILSKSSPLLDESIEREMAGATDSEARSQALKKIGGWLSRFDDSVGRAVRIDNLKNRHQVSEALLRSVLKAAPVASRPQDRGGVPPGRPSPERQGPPPDSMAPPMPTEPRMTGTQRRPPSGSRRPGGMHPSEKRVLAALVRWRDFFGVLDRLSRNLPPDSQWSDLFEYLPAKNFTAEAFFSRSAAPGDTEISALTGPWRVPPEQWASEIEDMQVRSTITEALIGDESAFSEQEMREAGDWLLYRTWARFSQRIRSALASPEACNNPDMQKKLMEDYLDVQRKMKEFNNFYDEA